MYFFWFVFIIEFGGRGGGTRFIMFSILLYHQSIAKSHCMSSVWFTKCFLCRRLKDAVRLKFIGNDLLMPPPCIAVY